jgi:hypothetical protein
VEDQEEEGSSAEVAVDGGAREVGMRDEVQERVQRSQGRFV